jgi:hypothetical protein
MGLKSNNFMDADVSHGGKIDFILGLLYWGYWSKTCKYVIKEPLRLVAYFKIPFMGLHGLKNFKLSLN